MPDTDRQRAKTRAEMTPAERMDYDMHNPPAWGMVCTDVLDDPRVTDRHLRVLVATAAFCGGWGYPRPEKPAAVAEAAHMPVDEVERLMRDLAAWDWLYQVETDET